jgi:hypothetical protein
MLLQHNTEPHCHHDVQILVQFWGAMLGLGGVGTLNKLTV